MLSEKAEYLWNGSRVFEDKPSWDNTTKLRKLTCFREAAGAVHLSSPFLSACDVISMDAWETHAMPPAREATASYSTAPYGTTGLFRISETAELESAYPVLPEDGIGEHLRDQYMFLAALPLLAAKLEAAFFRMFLLRVASVPDCGSLNDLAEGSLKRSKNGDTISEMCHYHNLTLLCHPRSLDEMTLPRWAMQEFRPQNSPPAVIATPNIPPPGREGFLVVCTDISSHLFFMSPVSIEATWGKHLWQVKASVRCTVSVRDAIRPTPVKGEIVVIPRSHRRERHE